MSRISAIFPDAMVGTTSSEGSFLLGKPAANANCVNRGIAKGAFRSGMVSAENGFGGGVYERVQSRKKGRLRFSLAEEYGTSRKCKAGSGLDG